MREPPGHKLPVRHSGKPSRRDAPGRSNAQSDKRAGDEIDAYLAAVVEGSEDAIISKTMDGTITTWNKGAERIFGYRADEVLGRPITIIIPRERIGEEEAILARIRRGERIQHYETVRVRKDGSHVEVSLSVSPIRNVNGTVIGTAKIARDISEHKRARESAAQFRLAIESAPNGMVMVDERGTISMVNAQMERLFGYDRSEMLGQSIEMLLPGRFRGAHPGLRQEFMKAPQTRAMGRGRDLYARRKDGSEFPVEVGLNPAHTPEGVFVLASLIDITQRKQMEADLAKAHADLQSHAAILEATVTERTAHLQRTIAELEGVSYSLSHDMRAPLRAIQGFTQIVLAEAGEKLGAQEQELLKKSINAAGRLDRLIQDVLTYTRVSRQPIAVGNVDVEKLLRQIIDERPELQPPKAEIVIESPLLQMRGHEASLTQCLTNLLDNAAKFVPPGRQPRVRIWTENKGDEVLLFVEDNGIGIPKDAQERLFGIFQRVHDERMYPGTGIGLAIVRKAAERMGGSVNVQSESGRGSRFCVKLPRGD